MTTNDYPIKKFFNLLTKKETIHKFHTYDVIEPLVFSRLFDGFTDYVNDIIQFTIANPDVLMQIQKLFKVDKKMNLYFLQDNADSFITVKKFELMYLILSPIYDCIRAFGSRKPNHYDILKTGYTATKNKYYDLFYYEQNYYIAIYNNIEKYYFDKDSLVLDKSAQVFYNRNIKNYCKVECTY